MKKKRAKMVLFARRPKMGDLPLYPLSAGRVALLEERENPLVLGAQGEEGEVKVSRYGLMEMMMVCALSDEELAPLMALDETEWNTAVNRFSLETGGEYVGEFSELMREELEAISENVTVPKKKTARKKGRR